MSKGFKALVVVLLVGNAVPLWFIAWRMYDEWRVRNAYEKYLVEYQELTKGMPLSSRSDEIQKRAHESWNEMSPRYRALGLSHPVQWGRTAFDPR